MRREHEPASVRERRDDDPLRDGVCLSEAARTLHHHALGALRERVLDLVDERALVRVKHVRASQRKGSPQSGPATPR